MYTLVSNFYKENHIIIYVVNMFSLNEHLLMFSYVLDT